MIKKQHYKYRFITEYSKFLNSEDLKKYKNPEIAATKENYPDDEAVILYEERKSEIFQYLPTKVKIANTNHIVKKLLTNISNASETKIFLEPNEELIDLNVRVILPNDSIIVLSENDYIKGSFQFGLEEQNEDVQGKYIKVIYPKIIENSIIEYSWRIVKDFAFFGDSWLIQDSNATKVYAKYSCNYNNFEMKPHYEVVYDPYTRNYYWMEEKGMEFGFNYQLHGDTINDKVEYNHYQKGYDVLYNWIFKDVKAFQREANMPPDLYFQRRLTFNYYAKPKWNIYADFYSRNLPIDPIEKQKFVRSVYDSLVNGINTKQERVDKLIDYVRNIRYEMIPLGSRGLIPQSPSQVIKNGYGDCKDKSSLLIQLLKIMDVRSFPAILLTADKGLLDKRFPYWNFNHMIVYVNDSSQGEFWVDPTVVKSKKGQLPWQDQGVNALILGGKNGVGFLTTPLANVDENKRYTKISIYNLDSALASIDISMKFYGEDDLMIRNTFYDMPKKLKEESIMKFLADELASSKVDSIYFADFDDFSKPFEIFIKLKTNRILNNQGNIVLLNYNVTGGNNDADWTQTTKRKYPVFIPYKSVSEKEFEIKYPLNKLKVDVLPEDFNENISYCSYEKSFFDDNNGLIVCKSKYIENALSIPKDKFEIAKAFNLNISKFNQKQIIFSKVNP